MTSSTSEMGRAMAVADELEVPIDVDPVIMTPNPLWDRWREDLATTLCLRAPASADRVAAPCFHHLRVAGQAMRARRGR